MTANPDIPVRSLRGALIRSTGEWLFALFLFAGFYKADPRLAFIQTHIDITVLFLILSLSVTLYRVLKRPVAYKLPRSFVKVATFFLLLIICLVGGLLYTESKEYGYDKVLRFAIITGWAFFGGGLLVTNFLSLRQFSWAIVLISTVMAIDALAGYPGIGKVGFVTALGSNYIALARAGGLGLLTTVVFLLPTSRKPLLRLALSGMAALQLWAALSAGARGPALALFLSFVFFFILSVRGFPSIRIERYALLLGALMLCVLTILAVIGEDLFSTLAFRTQVLVVEGGSSALTRFALYREALGLWSRSPIWGNGVGQFSVAVAGEDIRLYPHNIILELGAETGLIGVLIFVAMLGVAFVKPLFTLDIRKGLAKTVTRYLLVACCFALLNAMVSGDINDNRILFALIPLLASVHRFQDHELKKPSNMRGT